MPKISVLIPYYNDKRYLGAAIDSVLAQTFNDFELVLLDHASTDGSHEVAHSYKDPRIKHIQMRKNIGAGGGLLFIEFLNLATGEYLKPFCSDDIMKPTCLEVLSTYLDKNPQHAAVFGDMSFVDQSAKPLDKAWYDTRRRIPEVELAHEYLSCRGSFLPYPCSMLRRSAIDVTAPDRICIQIADHFVWMHMILNGQTFGYVDEALVDYRIHDEQMSSARSRNIERRSMFENIVFPNVFLKVKDVDFIKRLLRESFLAQRLEAADADLIPFVVAQSCSEHTHPASRIWGLTKLYELMADDAYRLRVESKFGYGVRDLRMAYSTTDLLPSIQQIGFMELFRLLISKFRRAVVNRVLRVKTRDVR